MEEFTGKLVPVSTDSILGGFQRVTGFETATTSGGASRLIANAFGSGVPSVHYYKTSLFLRSRSKDLNIYLANIGFEDDSTEDPISTAMRLGLVVQGKEYIFEINQAHNPGADDNAAKEPEGGYVLLHDREDGSTVPFTPLNADNFCIYDNTTGTVTIEARLHPAVPRPRKRGRLRRAGTGGRIPVAGGLRRGLHIESGNPHHAQHCPVLLRAGRCRRGGVSHG